MAKYIHYCWYGDKPLSKLAKKCMKSWKKYLPDYEIIRWDETNCDLNECEFVKGAYQNKKWAFVADYFRTKALYEMGGLYFDTDMEITKDISELLENASFLGVEDSGNIAVGVWWEKESKGFLPKLLLDFYREQEEFNIEDMYSISIPKIVTNELKKYGFKNNCNDIQILNNITIYPREYFYPLSYDRENNIFTEKTCMIHYYDASWTPKWEKNQIKIIRIFGRKNAKIMNDFIYKIKQIVKKILKVLLFPILKYKHYKNAKRFFLKRKQKLELNLEKVKKNEVLAIHNSDWMGTTNATKDMFDNTLDLPELYEKDDFDFFAKKILTKRPKLIVFSALAIGWDDLIKKLKENDESIKIKILWHGSNAMNMYDYDFAVFNQAIKLLNEKYIISIGFVKKSMYEMYKKLGYNVEFVANNVTLNKIKPKKQNNNEIKIGIYASGDRWVKNFYNQLAAASLIENAIIDVIPLSTRVKEFSEILKCYVMGESKNLSRDKMIERIAQNDINLYASFVDCAPLTPLESLEMGVPCITGNNHHYWEGTELEKYLVVEKADNCIQIAKKIELCLKNKEKIMKLYKEWKKEYDKECKTNFEKFISE